MRLLLLSLLVAGCQHEVRAPRAPVQGEPAVRLATYNVNYGLAGDPAGLAAIVATDADIVCLQETTPAWERTLRAVFDDAYPHMAFVSSPAAGGLAVLSRFPLEVSEVVEPSVGWFPAWRGVFTTPLGRLQVLQVHLRPPVSDGGSWVWGYLTTDDVRRSELRTFVAELGGDLPTAVVGDFNAEPGDEALTWLTGEGFRSTLADYAPADDTWRWPTSVLTFTGTLDHIFVNTRLDAVSARVVRRGRSDHLPVVATLVRRPPTTAAR